MNIFTIHELRENSDFIQKGSTDLKCLKMADLKQLTTQNGVKQVSWKGQHNIHWLAEASCLHKETKTVRCLWNLLRLSSAGAQLAG
jgi:hypothetical protein